MRSTRIGEDVRVSGRERGILRARIGCERWKERLGAVRVGFDVKGTVARGRGTRVRNMLGVCD